MVSTVAAAANPGHISAVNNQHLRGGIGPAHGGPAELVDKENGCAIEAGTPEQVVNDLQFAFVDMLALPHKWAARGKRGRERVEMHFDWCRKITAAEELYREVSGQWQLQH